MACASKVKPWSPASSCLALYRPPRDCRSTVRCSTATRSRRAPYYPRSHQGRRCSKRLPSAQRLVQVAHRRLLSPDNLGALKAVRLASAKPPLEFVVAVPGRRYNEFIELLAPLHELQCVTATREVISEQPGNGLRLVVTHDPIAAATKPEHRNERIDALIRQADQWTGTLTEQDEGVKHRGASSRTATIMDLERDHRRCQRDTRRKARPGPPQTIWGSARLLKEGDHYEKRIRGNFKVS